MSRKRVLFGACLLALVAAVVVAPGIQLAGGATERVANGHFEEGFRFTPAGEVGNGWYWFRNGGEATYGFYDETWAPVIYDGQHSQLIEINTYSRGESEPDRYAGIYQTVAVVPGEMYELSLQGMLRSLEGDPDRESYDYRVQYGVDYDGGTDWTTVDDWFEIPWDTVYPRLSPGSMEPYSTTIAATGPRLTLFVRVWKKWGTLSRELDVNLDAISLKGALPAGTGTPSVDLTAPTYPVVGWRYAIPVEGSNDVGITKLAFYVNDDLVDSVTSEVGSLSLSHSFSWTPAIAGNHILKAVAHDTSGAQAIDTVTVMVGEEGQFLTNGDFEGGFTAHAKGMVGTGWQWFENGGEATYGYYDETWTPVVYDGDHSQLIEINTFQQGGSGPDRYSGISQKVEGLTPGATYQLALHGMLRVPSDDADREGYGYRVQWGYDPSGGNDWVLVDNWVEIPWDEIFPRLDPGEMSPYSIAFEVPSSAITLYIRAWKKWGTASRELDVNLDAITLKGFK